MGGPLIDVLDGIAGLLDAEISRPSSPERFLLMRRLLDSLAAGDSLFGQPGRTVRAYVGGAFIAEAWRLAGDATQVAFRARLVDFELDFLRNPRELPPADWSAQRRLCWFAWKIRGGLPLEESGLRAVLDRNEIAFHCATSDGAAA
jgi:hypothetical protein